MRETELFEYLKTNYYPDLEQADDKFSYWDCTSKIAKTIIELKCRKTHYDTMLIEKKKYDALLEKALETGWTPLYVNYTPKGIYSWDLTKVKVKWKKEHKHPATTDFQNRKRVEKKVGYLPIDDGRVLYEPE